MVHLAGERPCARLSVDSDIVDVDDLTHVVVLQHHLLGQDQRLLAKIGEHFPLSAVDAFFPIILEHGREVVGPRVMASTTPLKPFIEEDLCWRNRFHVAAWAPLSL